MYQINLMELEIPDDIKHQLQEVITENELLRQKLIGKEISLNEANSQIEDLEQKLEKEKQYSAELRCIDAGSSRRGETSSEDEQEHSYNTDDNDDEQVESIETLEENHESDKEKANLRELKHQLKRKFSLTPINELMLACTLCGGRIKVGHLESHSMKCSSDLPQDITTSIDSSATKPGMIVATVTTFHTESTSADDLPTLGLKVICKTTLPDFKHPLLVATRTAEDFGWFRNALEQLHPQYIIPPFTFRDDLIGILREAQCFLSRVCAHNVLKCCRVTKDFFGASSLEFERVRVDFEENRQPRMKHNKPSIEKVDRDGLVFRSQTYFSQMIIFLESIIQCFEVKKCERSGSTLSLSQTFLALSYGERSGTYLHKVSKSLSNVFNDIGTSENGTYGDMSLIQDLESIVEYIRSANDLLSRVERSFNTYFYWEEEVKLHEQTRIEGLVREGNEASIEQVWAQAAGNNRTAKNELEDMVQQLSEELASFDRRKEDEIREVLVEYAESRSDVCAALQNKWLSVKLMLNSEIQDNVRSINFNL